MSADQPVVISADEMDRRLADAVSRLFVLIQPTELARQLSRTADPTTGRVRRITPQGVSKWMRNKRIPADRCLTVEAIVTGAMTRYAMRPDVFGQGAEMRAAG